MNSDTSAKGAAAIRNHFLFEQIDSWFFRESRSMDGSGASILSSLFPPPSKTLLGAIRSQIGHQYHLENNTCWGNFKDGDDLSKIIGYADRCDPLKVFGTFLWNAEEKQLYFPCPMNVLKEKSKGYGFFTLGEPVVCDMGNVRLPSLNFAKGQKAMEAVWIGADQMDKVLKGIPPEKVVAARDMIVSDPRLGIARDNRTRMIQKSNLYQTSHIRMKKEWFLYMGMGGISQDAQRYVPTGNMIRLGGEARMAYVSQAPEELCPCLKLPAAPQPQETTRCLVLSLVTPLPVFSSDDKSPPLPGRNFAAGKDKENESFWQGRVAGDGQDNAGTEVKVVSAVVGKPERVGGWDVRHHCSLPVRSFIPAGSCWYLDVENQQQAKKVVNALHGSYLTTGNDRALGYGQVLVGLAPEPETDETSI